MNKTYKNFVNSVAIAQEEFLMYGVIHPKTERKMLIESSRYFRNNRNKMKFLRRSEKQSIYKTNSRCVKLFLGTGQILHEALTNEFWPIPEVDYEDHISWLESAVSYLDRSLKNHLKKEDFNSIREAYIPLNSGKIEDTEYNVSYYAGLSGIITAKKSYKALLKITKNRRKELEDLIKK